MPEIEVANTGQETAPSSEMLRMRKQLELQKQQIEELKQVKTPQPSRYNTEN